VHLPKLLRESFPTFDAVQHLRFTLGEELARGVACSPSLSGGGEEEKVQSDLCWQNLSSAMTGLRAT